MAEIDPDIIKKTQDTLGKFIKKPPLTEKLLSRPPFRFLHDIVTSVISNTGFMKGLFTDYEMNSENVKEKEAKLAFLEKLIGIISLVLNKSIDIKASSIVAGKESEKTNYLLQCLAKAINKKVDNATFVKRTLDGEAKKLNSSKSNTNAKEKAVGKSAEKPKVNEASNEDLKNTDKPKPKKNSETPNTNDAKPTVQSAKPKKPKESNTGDDKRSKKPPEKNEVEISKEKEKEKDREREKEKEIKKQSKNHRNRSEKTESVIVSKEVEHESRPVVSDNLVETRDENNLNDDTDNESSKKLQRPSSAKGTRQKHENDNHILSENKEIETKKPMVRPPSARPAPPKLRKSSDAAVEEGINLLTSQSKVSGLIVDMDQDSDEGDFIVEEFVGGGDIDIKFSHTTTETAEEDGVHGALVQKIIQSKKDFTGSEEKGEVISHSDLNRKRERLANEKEIEKIRQNLQALTKFVNPLGKLVDFIQEDLDTMQKEADRWRLENDELDKKLSLEQNLTNKLIKPIKEKLNDEIKTYSMQEETIAKLKAKIEANSKKIDKMLFNMCSASA